MVYDIIGCYITYLYEEKNSVVLYDLAKKKICIMVLMPGPIYLRKENLNSVTVIRGIQDDSLAVAGSDEACDLTK